MLEVYTNPDKSIVVTMSTYLENQGVICELVGEYPPEEAMQGLADLIGKGGFVGFTPDPPTSRLRPFKDNTSKKKSKVGRTHQTFSSIVYWYTLDRFHSTCVRVSKDWKPGELLVLLESALTTDYHYYPRPNMVKITWDFKRDLACLRTVIKDLAAGSITDDQAVKRVEEIVKPMMEAYSAATDD